MLSYLICSIYFYLFSCRTRGNSENISVGQPQNTTLKFYVSELSKWLYIDLALLFTGKLGKLITAFKCIIIDTF